MASRKGGAGEKLEAGEEVNEEQEGSLEQAEHRSEGPKRGLTWPEQREEGRGLRQGWGTPAKRLRATRHKRIIELKAENTKWNKKGWFYFDEE